MARRLQFTFALLVCLGAIAARGEGPRKYAKDFSDQDLTGKRFENQVLENCNFENADCTNARFDGATLTNCNFQGAVLNSTSFSKCDLTGADFRKATFKFPAFYGATLNKANFSGTDLSSVSLHELKLRGANLSKVKGLWDISGADFFNADLRGANFQKARDDQSSAKFRKAKYDRTTRWHTAFDADDRGAYLAPDEETGAEAKLNVKPEVKPEPKPNTDTTPVDPSSEDLSQKGLEKAFRKLDINEDNVLTGKETKGLESCDLNSDGEITLAEFLKAKGRKAKRE